MTKLLILLCCTYTLASHHSHVIPVEHYETELQDLGQHVEIPETPVKVIKITKTIAVKIPVPYPVKVTEKVPYPVHVSKPYPVAVPHIVKIPNEVKVTSKAKHENIGSGYESIRNGYEEIKNIYNEHETQSNDPSSSGEHAFAPIPENSHAGGYNYGQNYGPQDYGDYSQGPTGHSYDAPVGNHYGYSGSEDEGSNLLISKSLNAIKNFL